MNENRLALDMLPFHIGPTLTPRNPGRLPSVAPFVLEFEGTTGVLTQRVWKGLVELLEKAYGIGQQIGTPLVHEGLGRSYADDFVSCIRGAAPAPGRALEVGAGAGYVSRVLADEGWRVDSLEPGAGYADSWRAYGLDVIQEFFPSPRATGPYDLVCSYAVLEHIADPVAFLGAIREHLAPGGVAVLAVPDCAADIVHGDPGMLVHEHYSYFEPAGLTDVFARSGLTASVGLSGFGRALYAVARRSTDSGGGPGEIPAGVPTDVVRSYPSRCSEWTGRARDALDDLGRSGSVGVYCPARALAVLTPEVSVRLFDDAPAFHGRFIPPFDAPIENRDDLVADPPDSVLIMSRTFGRRIQEELHSSSPGLRTVRIDEL